MVNQYYTVTLILSRNVHCLDHDYTKCVVLETAQFREQEGLDHSWLRVEAAQDYLVPSRVSAFLMASGFMFACVTEREGQA